MSGPAPVASARCVEWLRYPEPPDRRRRAEIFAEAYGWTSLEGPVIAVQRAGLETVRALAAQGRKRQVTAPRERLADAVGRDIAWAEENRQLF